MNYMQVNLYDTANGEGIRTVLFVSGCTNYCKNCHNPQTWDFNAGQIFTNDILQQIIQSLQLDYVSGLTITGGDPCHEKNIETVANICEAVKKNVPNKDIWVYTGYTMKQLLTEHQNDYNYIKMLQNIDILMDGKYIQEQSPSTLPFRGSNNQQQYRIVKSNEKIDIINLDIPDNIYTLHKIKGNICKLDIPAYIYTL